MRSRATTLAPHCVWCSAGEQSPSYKGIASLLAKRVARNDSNLLHPLHNKFENLILFFERNEFISAGACPGRDICHDVATASTTSPTWICFSACASFTTGMGQSKPLKSRESLGVSDILSSFHFHLLRAERRNCVFQFRRRSVRRSMGGV